ncbi:MAG: UDP-N-acetylmuramoyl-L-alanine--D-glutamate ligase [Clostridia bacterium]|nr:UDP-N-acetylmuramoyl-L-alanine--D-glutamate ligase [Clostridia bacterium]
MNIKKALVIGMARSGIAAVKLLSLRGAQVIVNDSKTIDKFADGLAELKLPGVEFRLGEDPTTLLEGCDALIISPGVPVGVPVVVKAKEMGIEVMGELEYAYRESKGRLMAITGTNGKTTTTTLLSEIFKDAGDTVYTVGNIGNPYTGEVPAMQDGHVTVCEVSSFQLETVKEFHPEVSAVLNISEDHLNRHGDMDTYIAMKKRIFANSCGGDSVVLNWDDPVTREMANDVKCNVVWFSTNEPVPYGAFVDDGMMVYGSKNSYVPVCPAADLQIPGRHNLANALAATAMAIAAGVGAESICKTLRRFQSVEHRIEFTREVSGVKFYNDSKGTNVDSTIQAVRAMDRPTVLIAGGSDKHSDFTAMVEEIKLSRIENIVLIGDTAKQIADTLDKCGYAAYEHCGYDFVKAISRAFELAKDGGSVLLSPACASFDMFKDYEERGREFKRIVKDLEPKML